MMNISHTSGVGRFNIKVLTDSVSDNNLLLGSLIGGLSTVSTHGRRNEGSLCELFQKGTNLIHENSALMT